MNTKEEQRLKTEYFMENFDEIKKAPELNKILEDVEKIYEIAQGFRKGYKIAAEIANCKRRI